MDETRLIELETKFAYQEETLRELNEIVTAQQKQLEQLKILCRQLLQRIDSGGGAVKGAVAEEVPPHY